ncbi:PREDICTED: uncharacterized protein LOC108369911 [Rhagoletis zephyria]|uniref:uncharacterized protein LOC108369911 n=1 Tax=Rhagoletis zephyria TaxID=28612 RepID=UPI0008114D31|nr:PREDICTED: uncharacterized protein LOC108369911 [Rhagoletis zephyria]XP_036345983.1 uncharacterized protein LOC118755240 [Rhagoletis pomonella]
MPLDHTPTKLSDSHASASLGKTLLDVSPPPETNMSTIHGQSTSQAAAPTAPAAVEAVSSYKIPPFWKTQPRLWFIQAEAVFHSNRIASDLAKYNQVVSALDTDSILQMADFLHNPPDNDKYAKFKDEIIKRFTESTDRQLHRALTEIQLEDKKPSQLLRQLKILTGSSATGDVLRVRWLALLPPAIVRCIKLLRNTTLEEQAEIADELMENQTGTGVMATYTNPSHAVADRKLADTILTSLAKDITSMKLAVADLATCTKELTQTLTQNPPHRASRGRGQQRSNAREASSAPAKLCFYHRKHGEKAKRCVLPCTFKANSGN